jgi:hypothetical protein
MEQLTVHTQNNYKSLLTKRHFTKGEIVSKVPCTAIHNEPSQYTVQAAKDRHIEVGRLAYMNHSCNPNIIVDTTHMLAVAARDIAPGEELTFFYPSTEWEMTVPFICLCGSPNCIHVVAGAKFLSLSTLERYYINRHIRDLICDLLVETDIYLAPIQAAR